MSSKDWVRKSFPFLSRLSDKEIDGLTEKVRSGNKRWVILNVIALWVGVFSVFGMVAEYLGIDIMRDRTGWVMIGASIVIALLFAIYTERKLIVHLIKKKR